jgi:hypothetical protein
MTSAISSNQSLYHFDSYYNNEIADEIERVRRFSHTYPPPANPSSSFTDVFDRGLNESTIYAQLAQTSHLTNTTDKKELLKFKDILLDINRDIKNTNNELELHGLSKEEIEELNEINCVVHKGRDKLIEYLQEYDSCLTEIKEYENKVLNVKGLLDTIKCKLLNLESYHDDFIPLSKTFLESLITKETDIIDDLQGNMGCLCIKRDRLETLIKSLGSSYNILKNAPFTHICPICITHEVDTYIEPCGHTLCGKCNQNVYCHMCRTKIRGTRSLFYS